MGWFFHAPFCLTGLLFRSLEALFRSSSRIAAETKSRRDVSSTVPSQTPANLHWSSWAAEPGTRKASATPRMRQKQSEPKWRKSSSMALDLCKQNGKWSTEKEGEDLWLWGRTEPPSRSILTCGRGWELPSAAPGMHLSLQPGKNIPHSHPCLSSWNSGLSCMPECSPELQLS